jgi:hypothetical protein
MSRNFYILAATLGFSRLSRRHGAGAFELSAGPAGQRHAVAHGGAVSAAGGLGSALIGVMSNLFEQVDRRSEEARRWRGESGAAKSQLAIDSPC